MCFLMFLIQIEADTGFVTIYDGGSDKAEMIVELNDVMNGSKISTPRNQLFLTLHTPGRNTSIRINAAIIKSEYW